MKKIKWELTQMGNVYCDCGEFYISYNPHPSVGFEGEETALKHEKGEWLILIGDFRKDYEKLIPRGYKFCEKFYQSKIKTNRGSWSTDRMAGAR